MCLTTSHYTSLGRADLDRVNIAVQAVADRFDELRESLPDFSDVDALLVAVHFYSAVVHTTALDAAPLPGEARTVLYRAAIDTIVRRLERDRDDPGIIRRGDVGF